MRLARLEEHLAQPDLCQERLPHLHACQLADTASRERYDQRDGDGFVAGR
jgi:hypothetical protein